MSRSAPPPPSPLLLCKTDMIRGVQRRKEGSHHNRSNRWWSQTARNDSELIRGGNLGGGEVHRKSNTIHFRLGVGIRWLTDKKSKANIYPCNIPRRRDANQPPMPWLNPVWSAEYGADSAWRRMTMVSMLVVQAEMCTSFDLKVVHLNWIQKNLQIVIPLTIQINSHTWLSEGVVWV